ncbi:translation repressor RelB [Acinetobacter sp. Ac_3412]|uniref:type II toxin-antitoxin system RelB/DinJ family antitoxin n=1 Tax=Acinetobacter sp. Ac_3412 TaxID=1848935 RepID=UPI0014906F22|nr:type II toxin-antitoxin system RelB/DinJ family antitoxin [Acinetobacter sp. Ac_3412]NNP77815.1 translation repressor RelB [Acinetobacter sp. Ac_3412]
MATVYFRVNDSLKAKSYAVLKEQGIAPNDFFTSVLEYIATTGRLPIQKIIVSDEDADLLEVVLKRLNDPKDQFEEITLNDL